MKKRRLLLVVTILILLSLAALSVWEIKEVQHPPLPSVAIQRNAVDEVPLLSDKEEVLSDQSSRLTINIHYPSVLLVGHPEFGKETNAVIAGFIAHEKDRFRKEVAEVPPSETANNFTSDFTMRYTPLLLSPTIISIRFDSSTYIAGAAHPNNQVRVLNYDMTKQLILGTSDLFASSTEALPFLSTSTRMALRTMFSGLTEQAFQEQVLHGTEPTNENFDAVGINNGGLVVFFNPYQVAPHARGVIAVPITLADLGELIGRNTREAIRMAKENIVEAKPLDE